MPGLNPSTTYRVSIRAKNIKVCRRFPHLNQKITFLNETWWNGLLTDNVPSLDHWGKDFKTPLPLPHFWKKLPNLFFSFSIAYRPFLCKNASLKFLFLQLLNIKCSWMKIFSWFLAMFPQYQSGPFLWKQKYDKNY